MSAINNNQVAAAPALRAAVTVRCSSGGGKFVYPVRVYLLQCEVDNDGDAVMPWYATSAPAWTRVNENLRATRQMRILVEKGKALAQQVNAGEMEFAEAAIAFHATARDLKAAS